ncbi:hypothetical protein F5880DRAFT_1509413 [Lentinula raphanica]|nr:hypothetical protein F5880DRAFT_1509413 [Lentinula raphanica]
MFSLASTNSSPASCVRLLRTVTFVLWLLGVAEAMYAPGDVGSVHHQASATLHLNHWSEVVLHIPNQPALTTLSDHLFLSIGQYYFNVEHASLKVRQLARSERAQPAGSPGSGPKLLGYVRSLDPNAEYHAVQAAYSRVKDQKNGDPRILFTQLLNALSTQIGAFMIASLSNVLQLLPFSSWVVPAYDSMILFIGQIIQYLLSVLNWNGRVKAAESLLEVCFYLSINDWEADKSILIICCALTTQHATSELGVGRVRGGKEEFQTRTCSVNWQLHVKNLDFPLEERVEVERRGGVEGEWEERGREG